MAGTVVDVDSGVKVFLGVDVDVPAEGTAASVCNSAASNVCAMNVLMEFGSSGGTGVTMDGAHARTSRNAMLQRKILRACVIRQRSL